MRKFVVSVFLPCAASGSTAKKTQTSRNWRISEGRKSSGKKIGRFESHERQGVRERM
jgi:hypothetical protein